MNVLNAQQAFVDMLTAGDEMAVAWDRDVPQELVSRDVAPRLYCYDSDLFRDDDVVCVGSTDTGDRTHHMFKYTRGRWIKMR